MIDDDALHEQLTWRLYLLGRLDERQDLAFERHLAGCAACQADCDAYGGLVVGMVGLDEADLMPAVPVGPVSATRQAGRRWWRSRPVLVFAAAAAVVVLALVTVVGTLPTGSDSAVFVRTQSQVQRPKAHLSVTMVEHDGRLSIRATVTGLSAGVRYRLYAVTAGAATILVSEWDGAAGVQEVVGEIARPADRIALFSVTTLDASPVATAEIPR
jgi:anti-sigma factor RsiW